VDSWRVAELGLQHRHRALRMPQGGVDLRHDGHASAVVPEVGQQQRGVLRATLP
jgi:hypothetical protein